MFEPVGSTSWHNRHLSYFRELNAILIREGITNPTIMIVGPGAVTQIAALFLNDAAKDTSSVRKLIGDAARYSDQLLRRIPGMPLKSLEPAEVSSALTMPHQLLVVDWSARVLQAVKRRFPKSMCHQVDLAQAPICATADVVIAFNIICRLEENAAQGMKHLIESVRPGGWLLIDDRSADRYLTPSAGFEKVSDKIHRRIRNRPSPPR